MEPGEERLYHLEVGALEGPGEISAFADRVNAVGLQPPGAATA
jgi:hypothetical protein